MLEARNISYRIGEKTLLKPFNLRVEPGDFIALVGPNGAGKSTALRLLCGEWQPATGSVWLDGQPLGTLSARNQARRRACFEQNQSRDFPFTVREITALGRHPHQEGFFESARDHHIVKASMAEAGVTHLADRQQQTLSGGEATRAHLARVLAQEPAVLLLDEPTNHLDIHYQEEIMRLCRARIEDGCAVVAVLHDLNLAARFANRILVLYNGTIAADGPPLDALTPGVLKAVYGIDCVVWTHPSGCPWVVPLLGAAFSAVGQNDARNTRAQPRRVGYPS